MVCNKKYATFELFHETVRFVYCFYTLGEFSLKCGKKTKPFIQNQYHVRPYLPFIEQLHVMIFR